MHFYCVRTDSVKGKSLDYFLSRGLGGGVR